LHLADVHFAYERAQNPHQDFPDAKIDTAVTNPALKRAAHE
jgi:hypothetical protein